MEQEIASQVVGLGGSTDFSLLSLLYTLGVFVYKTNSRRIVLDYNGNLFLSHIKYFKVNNVQLIFD